MKWQAGGGSNPSSCLSVNRFVTKTSCDPIFMMTIRRTIQQRLNLGVIIGALLLGHAEAFASEVSLSPFPGARVETRIESLIERRWKHVVRQSLDISCGSAALATILRYQFGDPVSEEALISDILKRVAEKEVGERGGFTLLDLKRVAMDFGYKVNGYKLGFQQLVELHTPALIPITIRGFKHFVVFRGVIGDHVVLADPAFGNLLVRDFLFCSVWKDVALVIKRDGVGLISTPLTIAEGDALVVDTKDALRNFVQPSSYIEMRADEF